MEIIVNALTAGILFFLSLATVSSPRKINVHANWWLSLFLFSFACILLDRVLFDAQVYTEYYPAEGLLEVTRYAMSPALYFSILCFTIPNRKFKAIDTLHFIPFFLLVCSFLPLYFELMIHVCFHGFTRFQKVSGEPLPLSLRFRSKYS
ncbi:MAG: hypothetical protein QM734_06755 [Cyclobacteriaceae bacterium]